MRYVKTTNGYLATFLPDHPMAHRNGYVYAHRLAMARHLGRTLTRSEQVHHKDENKANNAISNLELLSDAEHKRRHRKRGTALRDPGAPNPLVKCACRCGHTFPKFDPSGRPRFFISGHNKNAANTAGVKNPKKGIRGKRHSNTMVR